MILILASCRDRAARELAAEWSGAGAALVTCRDVCRPGWQAGDDGPETLRVDGQVLSASEVRGVLGRLGWVHCDELTHIAADDREYAAAELTAFLLAWLSALEVPMLNRPSASCLSGPGWRPEQWTRAATELGIAVRPTRRRVPGGEPAAPTSAEVTVTIAGARCLGAGDEAMATAARALARRADAGLVELRFAAGASEPIFTSANPWPDVAQAAVREGALGALTAVSADPRR